MTRDMDTVKMSYEEMIDTLKGLVFGTFDRTTVKEREALDMAIKALQTQAELSEDCVSRKSLIHNCKNVMIFLLMLMVGLSIYHRRTKQELMQYQIVSLW